MPEAEQSGKPFAGTETFVWKGAGHETPAPVPGFLCDALCMAGIIPEPRTGLQGRCGEWAATRVWELAGGVPLPPEEAERVFLCARGVRGSGALFAGGEEIGRFCDGDWETEITPAALDAAAKGNRTVQIGLRFDPRPPQGLPPRAWIGVSGGFFTRGVNQLRLDDWYPCASIYDGYGVAEFRSRVSPYVPGRYVFRCVAQYRGETLCCEETEERLDAAPCEVTLRATLPLPRAWRVGEENEPVFLRQTILRAGRVCEDRVAKAGFRETEFAASPARQLSVGGERVFLRGVEWRGGEMTDDDVLRARLNTLREGGVNCLRCYGLPEDALLDELDARGMLLWCVLPLDVETAAQAVRRARSHPCLIAYGCESVYASFNRPAALSHPSVAPLAEMCERLDGARPFFGPVPGGPVARPGREELGAGLCLDVLGPDDYPGPEALCRDGNADDALTRTVRCAAMSGRLEEMAAGETLWPMGGAFWRERCGKMPDAGLLREWFGLETAELASRAAGLSRYAQAETLRYWAERTRMREGEACGFFTGMPFEAVESPFSCALFDGDAPRPAWYALQSALRPAHVCARLERLGGSCDTKLDARVDLIFECAVRPGPLRVEATLYDAQGMPLAKKAFDAEAKTGPVGRFEAVLPENPSVLVLRLRLMCLDRLLDVNDYALCMALHAPQWPLAHAPCAAVRCVEDEARNICDRAALGVCCGGWKDAAWPGWGVLLPGERRKLCAGARLEALNLEPFVEGVPAHVLT